MDISEDRRRSLPPLHSPSLSEYSTASSSFPLDTSVTVNRTPSTSSSSRGGQETRSEQSYISLPPPPQPLDYESPVPNRRPLPVPPIRVSPKRPPLPTIPPPDAGGKGKARLVVMDEEKQAYARALGLDTVGEESDGVITSPTSPPGYVQNREADAREGLSKGGMVREEEAVVDEKGRGELERVAEAQEREAEEELAQDSSEEKARMARAEEERSEEDNARRQAVETAELAKEVSQLELGRGRSTPPPPMSPISPSDLPSHKYYPLDSKETSSGSRSRDSPTDSLFGSAVDDVPSYEAGPPSSPAPYHPPIAPFPTRTHDYGQFPPPRVQPQPQPQPQPSHLPPPPQHQCYATEPPLSPHIPHSSAPPAVSQQYLMFNAPAPPPPTSYVAERLCPSTENEGSRPPLARHMSLQPAAGRPYTGGGGVATSYASAAYAPPARAERRPPVAKASIGPGGGGFYSSGIGLAMHREVAPVFESSTRVDTFRRSPSPLRGAAAESSSEFGEHTSSYSHASHRSRASGQWATPLAPPSGFAQADPANYRQHFAQQSFQHPAPPTFAGHPQQALASPAHQQTSAAFQSPPVVSSAGLQPAGYYTFSPGSAPILFYNTSPISPLSPSTSPGVYQQQLQPSYFTAAPHHPPIHQLPSQLPPPPPPHAGYPAYIPPQPHQPPPLPHAAQGAQSPPLARPPSAISQAQSSIRAQSRGSVRGLFGRKGKKGKDSPALEGTEEGEGGKVLLWGWT